MAVVAGGLTCFQSPLVVGNSNADGQITEQLPFIGDGHVSDVLIRDSCQQLILENHAEKQVSMETLAKVRSEGLQNQFLLGNFSEVGGNRIAVQMEGLADFNIREPRGFQLRDLLLRRGLGVLSWLSLSLRFRQSVPLVT